MSDDIERLVGNAVAACLLPQILSGVRGIVREELLAAPHGDPDRLIDVHEAAMLLGMSAGAVRKAAARGTLPATRIGRRLRFRAGDLMSRGSR